MSEVFTFRSRVSKGSADPSVLRICPARPNQSFLASTEPSPNTTR